MEEKELPITHRIRIERCAFVVPKARPCVFEDEEEGKSGYHRRKPTAKQYHGASPALFKSKSPTTDAHSEATIVIQAGRARKEG